MLPHWKCCAIDALTGSSDIQEEIATCVLTMFQAHRLQPTLMYPFLPGVCKSKRGQKCFRHIMKAWLLAILQLGVTWLWVEQGKAVKLEHCSRPWE